MKPKMIEYLMSLNTSTGYRVCLKKFWPNSCLFESNKRQNGWTDRAQIFLGLHVTTGNGWSNFQKFPSTKIRFLKILNIREICLIKSAKLFVCFCFTMYTKRSLKHVHNWNWRWARNGLKAYYKYKTVISVCLFCLYFRSLLMNPLIDLPTILIGKFGRTTDMFLA